MPHNYTPVPIALFYGLIRELSTMPYRHNPHRFVFNLIEETIGFNNHFAIRKVWELWKVSTRFWMFLERGDDLLSLLAEINGSGRIILVDIG
jgi:hypothetical protein